MSIDAETEPAAPEAYLAALVQSSDDAIIGKDLNGIVTSWNAAAERMFGYTAEDMIGQPITRVIPHERLDERNLARRSPRGQTRRTLRDRPPR